MPKITVVTEGGTYTFENDTVENVAALIAQTGEALGIASNANIQVNGRPATAETPLRDGDEVSTTKPAGRKGSDIVTVRLAQGTITVRFL